MVANILDYPLVVFILSLVVLWLSARLGAWLRRRRAKLEEDEWDDLSVIQGATLTLLALIIGFSFSMAANRYDQRKNFEEAEANAIGTEYVRVALLPAADSAHARRLLRSYLEQRIQFYTTRDARRLSEVNVSTSKLQEELWSAVQGPSATQSGPVASLTLSGMNEVLNSQGYTQAAWWNRIPIAAWAMMFVIGICGNVLFGYRAQLTESKHRRFFVLPLIASIAFLLIADLDSPRGGVIRLTPQNLQSLVGCMAP